MDEESKAEQGKEITTVTIISLVTAESGLEAGLCDLVMIYALSQI
jgi:hypothetical protein